MKCPLCGKEFSEEESKSTCESCLLCKGCHMLKCPRCGYETPAEPGLIKFIRAWKEKIIGT